MSKQKEKEVTISDSSIKDLAWILLLNCKISQLIGYLHNITNRRFFDKSYQIALL